MITSTFSIKMFSGDEWKFSFGDFLLLSALALLFVEVVKATRTTSSEIINHGLSMLVFVVALIEFITLKGFATSTVLLPDAHARCSTWWRATRSPSSPPSTIWVWARPERTRVSRRATGSRAAPKPPGLLLRPAAIFRINPCPSLGPDRWPSG